MTTSISFPNSRLAHFSSCDHSISESGRFSLMVYIGIHMHIAIIILYLLSLALSRSHVRDLQPVDVRLLIAAVAGPLLLAVVCRRRR